MQELYEKLIDYGIASQEEIQLVTCINGYNIESLNDILYVRTGYRTIDQLESDILD